MAPVSATFPRPFTLAQTELGREISFSAMDLATLRAVSRKDERGREAFFAWWDMVDIDAAGPAVVRLAPFLYRRARAYGAVGPLTERLRGISRHVWLGNEMRMRALPFVLDVLEPAGGALLLKGIATLVRSDRMSDLRPIGDIDLLVDPDRLPIAVDALRNAGFHPTMIWPEDLVRADFDSIHAGAFEREAYENFDIHWRPMRDIIDRRLAGDMRDHAESLPFLGRTVRVPALADHLFHLLTHGVGAAKDGRIDFMLEAGMLVDGSASAIDWRRFRSLAARYMLEGAFRSLIESLRDDLDIILPDEAFPPRPSSPGLLLERRLRERPAGSDSPAARVFLDLMTWRRSSGRPKLGEALSALAFDRRLRASLALSAVDPQASGPAVAPMLARWAERVGCEPVSAGTAGRPDFLAGFSLPERTGRWTDGPAAALAVPAPGRRPGARLPVLIRAAPFLIEPSDRLTVTLATRTDRIATVMTGHAAARDLLLVGPVGRHGGIGVGLSIGGLRPPHPGPGLSPGSLGKGETRHLGLHVSDVRTPDLVAASLPARFAFDDRAVIYAAGWSEAEAAGRWTDGPLARLLCRVDTPAATMLEGTIWIGRAHIRKGLKTTGLVTSVAVIGHPALAGATLRDDAPATISFRFPSSVLMDGFLALEIAIDGAASPAELGLAPDTRQLGIFLERFMIGRI